MILPVVAFLAALGVGLFWERRGLRWLVVLAIVLAPMRGGLLALADDVGLPEFEPGRQRPGAGAGRGARDRGHRAGAAATSTTAQAAAGRLGPDRRGRADQLPAQSVGLKLYGVGLAQYLVYPTLVIAAWPLCRGGGPEQAVPAADRDGARGRGHGADPGDRRRGLHPVGERPGRRPRRQPLRRHHRQLPAHLRLPRGRLGADHGGAADAAERPWRGLARAALLALVF